MYTEIQFRNKITCYYFYTIIAVVLIHTFNLSVYGINADSTGLGVFVYYFESIAAELWNIAVPMFFMISGFLFFRNFTWDKLKSKYQSRFFSIVIPYLIWCSIYYLYYVILTRIPFVVRLMTEVSATPFNLSTWLSKLWVDEYYVFWFLKELIVLIILTPVIYFFLQNRWKIPTGLVVLILSVMIGRYVSYWPFNLYYLVGAYIGINHKQVPLKCDRRLTFIGGCGIILWILTAVLRTCDVIAWQLPTTLVLVCLWYAGDIFTFELRPKWWMGISFFIYCMHDMILEVYEKIFLKLFGISAVCALLDYILMPLLTTLTLIGIAVVMRKYLPKCWNVLTGGRG